MIIMNTFLHLFFPVTGADEDSLVMISGKEFSLIRTVGGKVKVSYLFQYVNSI